MFLLAIGGLLPAAAVAQDADLTLLKAAENVFFNCIKQAEPSVVSIARVRLRSIPDGEIFLQHRAPREEDLSSSNVVPNQFGAGVIVRENGMILTMYHVVRGGPTSETGEGDQKLFVRTSDRKVYPAYIHAADPRSDLAVLKITANGLKPLTYEFNGELRKGQFVIALGNPYAIARDGSASASWGILSNLGRGAQLDRAEEEGEDPDRQKRHTLHHLGTLLQLDMRLDLGTSGAPVLDLDGQLIGLSTSMAALAGYEKSAGFAIPMNPQFKRIIDDLVAGKEVEYGFLGINDPREVGPEALAKLPIDAPHRRGGATFSGVMGNSPSYARLHKEDIVLEVGIPVDRGGKRQTVWKPVFGPNDLMREVGILAPRTEIGLKVFQHGSASMKTVSVVLGKWPVVDDEGIVARVRSPAWRGVRVDYSTARKRYILRTFGSPMDVPPGVLVVEVLPDSPAAKAGLQPGDFITNINGSSQLRTPEEFLQKAPPEDSTQTVTVKLATTAPSRQDQASPPPRLVEIPPK